MRLFETTGGFILFKENVINFFNNAAEHWDDNISKDPALVNLILDNANVSSGKDILDVACGTGITFSRSRKAYQNVNLSSEPRWDFDRYMQKYQMTRCSRSLE